MKISSSLLIATIVSLLFIHNNVVAQITIIKTIANSANYFLGSADMDNDSHQELVYGYRDVGDFFEQIVIIDGVTGIIKWTSPITMSDISISGWNRNGSNLGFSPFCDINNNGTKAITFSAGGNIYIVGLQGTANKASNNNSIPNELSLMQNYPNPFNPTTAIEYQIQKNDFVTLKVFNILGQLVKTLVNESKQTGEYSVIFDGKNEYGQTISSGAYYYQLKVGDFVSSKKMILLK